MDHIWLSENLIFIKNISSLIDMTIWQVLALPEFLNLRILSDKAQYSLISSTSTFYASSFPKVLTLQLKIDLVTNLLKHHYAIQYASKLALKISDG